MGPLALMAIGAAMGAAKSQLVDKPKEDRDRKKAEAFARVSPWSRMGIPDVREADPWGSAIGGAGTGLAMSQQMPIDDGMGSMDGAVEQTGAPMANAPVNQPAMTPSGYPVGQPGVPSYMDWMAMGATGGAGKRPGYRGPMR